MKTFKFLTLSISILLLLLVQSCKKDPCSDVLCENGGICEEGICDCATGYEGATCAVLWRDKILGNYTQTDECTTGNFGPYDVVSEADPSGINKVLLIVDRLNADNPVQLTMTSATTFDVPKQSPCSTCSEISGSGNTTSDGGFTYNFDFAFSPGDNCVVTLVPK